MHGKAWPIAGGIAVAFVALELFFLITGAGKGPSHVGAMYTAIMVVWAFPALPLALMFVPQVAAPAYLIGGGLFYLGMKKLDGWRLFAYLSFLFTGFIFFAFYVTYGFLGGA